MDLSNSIIQRWPYLTEGLSREDGVILWKHRLRMSFKNLRRRSSALTTCPEVLNMKRKYGNKKDAEVQPPNKVQKDIWGVANFLPERTLGEDTTTILEYTEKAKRQKSLTVGRRNPDLMNLAMDKTFPDRRHALIVQFIRIPDLLDHYPL